MTGIKQEKKPLELYIHIPFCIRKCNYCDFLSGPCERLVQEQYKEALIKELKGRSSECLDYEVKTVFIGGGTPSVADAEWIFCLMDEVKHHYQVAKDAEITIEINPGTVDESKLQVYRNAGINRLSIGLQSASDQELQKLGRIHDFDQFLKTYEAAVASGFQNINVDVMSALPGQTLQSYEKTLQAVLNLDPKPTHISAYSLIIEESTPFYSLWEQGELELPDEECERQMYVLTKQMLEKYGYKRYEISNYALDGYACGHNIGYWRRREYLGIGIGAASFMNESRFCNDRDLKAYNRDPLFQRRDVQYLSKNEQMEEFMFLGLRMTKGVSDKEFYKQFDCHIEEIYGKVLSKNINDKLLVLEVVSVDGSKDRLYYLTDRGLDVSNYVMAQFLL